MYNLLEHDGVIPAIVFVAVLAAGALARAFFIRWLQNWQHAQTSAFDDVVLYALRGPMLLWALMLAIYVTMETSEKAPPNYVRQAERALLVLSIVSVTWAASRLAGRIVHAYGRRKSGTATGTLTEVTATLVVALLGALTLLNSLGIDIRPVLTALGVGGLAVALALQDTLSNFFSGFYVSLAGQVRVGDFIQLDSGQRGYVTDIGWRATTLRERANNLVVIPNNKLAQSIVTNYHLPDRRVQVSIPVNVAYASDPGQVRQIMLDAARRPPVMEDPPPVALLNPGFGERGLEFTLICHVADYEDQFRAQNEIRQEIVARFREAKITFASVFPPPAA